MNIGMNYKNSKGEIEEVSVLGFAHDSGWASRNHCECWSETKGHFITKIENLSVSEKTVRDVMYAAKEHEEMSEVLSAIVNKA